MKFKVVAVPVVALALALNIASLAAASPSSDRADDFTKAPSGRLTTSNKPVSISRDAKVDVMVQLSGDPVAVVQAKADRRLSKAERDAVRTKLRTAQDAIAGDIKAKGGKVGAQLQSAYNGMRVRIQESKAEALAALPGVVGVHVLTPRSIDNTNSVPFIGAPDAWTSTGKTGAGVKVAIIDTGIDYTHADFGGPGTTEAYTAAKAASADPADPTLFGASAPRVKGGYDFVGDAYDASDPEKDVPAPDANPLDCQGHGSHVAGTAAGSGVTSEGKTYLGAYTSAAVKNTAFSVGPGVAPEADLYALRVFGCDGSTDVVTEAIDWAVAHDMDVINMSLGGPFGRSTDPDAVAASNAVAAGVVVVASSGNAGQSPYLTGSPAVGQGVVSVAAVDSVGTFPGAEVKIADSTVLSVINANNAKLPSGNFPVVVLGQGNDADPFGCSVDAFAAAGVTAGGNQLAVVQRGGDCARIAKAIYGQQAGAAAVLMINNAAGYPPYEGEITENPDTGEAYSVTIPFLGAELEKAAAAEALAGTEVTLGGSTVNNPTFRQVASFSSAGPANGDSGLSPVVAAPGVSISSAAVGTGTGSTILSGTSMAAPHVAGVAALAVQAHPTWTASQIGAALVSTADPDKVEGYGVTTGGGGLVDPVQMVTTGSFATGDVYRTKSGRVAEGTLSFGFSEPSDSYTGTRTFTITNTSASAITYTLSNAPTAGSRPATVRLNPSRVRVPAGKSATVAVTLSVDARTVGSSLDGPDQFSLKQVAGSVVLTSSSGVLRVPYLMVPRARARVAGSLLRTRAVPAAPAGEATPSMRAGASLRLSNFGGALGAYADVYTLGLTDPADVPRNAGGSGYDLRAAGVQSFVTDEGTLLVFAVNTHQRWSNAATDEFDVKIDTNGDGQSDWTVLSYDSGYLRDREFNGQTEVFLLNEATGELSPARFMAQAPTDSSTILLPVWAESLGLSQATGGFAYTVDSYTIEGTAEDHMNGWAGYNPWQRPFDDGSGAMVARNATVSIPVTANLSEVAAQKPLGLMVAVLDNQSGASEAQLFPWR